MSAEITELSDLIDRMGPGWTEALLNVHPDTLKRWRSGKSRVPTAVLVALRAAALGQMPWRDRCWDGWFYFKGELHSPAGDRYVASDLAALPYLRGENRALRAQVADLQAQLAAARHAGEVLYPAANEADGAQEIVREEIAAPWP